MKAIVTIELTDNTTVEELKANGMNTYRLAEMLRLSFENLLDSLDIPGQKHEVGVVVEAGSIEEE